MLLSEVLQIREPLPPAAALSPSASSCSSSSSALPSGPSHSSSPCCSHGSPCSPCSASHGDNAAEPSPSSRLSAARALGAGLELEAVTPPPRFLWDDCDRAGAAAPFGDPAWRATAGAR